jgi:hypothetical protein
LVGFMTASALAKSGTEESTLSLHFAGGVSHRIPPFEKMPRRVARLRRIRGHCI